MTTINGTNLSVSIYNYWSERYRSNNRTVDLSLVYSIFMDTVKTRQDYDLLAKTNKTLMPIIENYENRSNMVVDVGFY